MLNEWLVANLQSKAHYLGDCPECSAFCAELAFDAVLGTPLGLVEAIQKRLKRESERSACFWLLRNGKLWLAWTLKHKDWFGYPTFEKKTQ